MEDQLYADPVANLGPEDLLGSTEGLNLRRRRRIRWENHEQAQYFVDRLGSAKFEINSGVGGMFATMFSFTGDCYAVLSTGETVGETKRFCEWTRAATVSM